MLKIWWRSLGIREFSWSNLNHAQIDSRSQTQWPSNHGGTSLPICGRIVSRSSNPHRNRKRFLSGIDILAYRRFKSQRASTRCELRTVIPTRPLFEVVWTSQLANLQAAITELGSPGGRKIAELPATRPLGSQTNSWSWREPQQGVSFQPTFSEHFWNWGGPRAPDCLAETRLWSPISADDFVSAWSMFTLFGLLFQLLFWCPCLFVCLFCFFPFSSSTSHRCLVVLLLLSPAFASEFPAPHKRISVCTQSAAEPRVFIDCAMNLLSLGFPWFCEFSQVVLSRERKRHINFQHISFFCSPWMSVCPRTNCVCPWEKLGFNCETNKEKTWACPRDKRGCPRDKPGIVPSATGPINLQCVR